MKEGKKEVKREGMREGGKEGDNKSKQRKIKLRKEKVCHTYYWT